MAYTRTGYANFAAFPVTGAVNIIYVDLSNGNEYTWVTSAYVAYTGTLAGIRTAYQTSAWFSANGSILLGKGQKVDLEQTGLFKLGDGVTLLSALEFKSSATHKDTAWFTANAAIVIEDKRLIYCSDGANQGKYKIGDGTTALSSLVFYGGISASGLTVGTTTITGGTSTRVLYNNAGVVGEYAVTGTGTTAVLSTSPVFGTDITTPKIIASDLLIYNSATEYYNFKTIYANFGGLYFNTASPGATNYTFGGDGAYAVVNAPTLAVLFRSGGTTFAQGTSLLSNVSGGQFSISPLTSLANTANSSVQKFISYGASTQWVSGTTPLQYENNFTAPTYSGVSATVITIAANVVSDFAIASTNMSISTNAAFYNPTRVLTTSTTNGYGALFNAPSGASTNWAIGAIGAVTSTIGYGVGATPSSTRPFNASATVAGEYSYFITNLSSGASAQAAIRLGNNSNEATIGMASTGATTGNGLYPRSLNFNINEPGGFSFNQQVSATSGAYTRFRIWGAGNYTGQTASTAISGFIWTSFSRTWANGGGITTIATQIENDWQPITYATSGGGTLTITNAYGNKFNAPVASGVTITNNYSALFNAPISLTQTVTTEALVSDTSVTIVINGTTYKLLAKA